MNRRHFLGSLLALSAGMLLDPERLLWVPGRKTYFDIVTPRKHIWIRTQLDASQFAPPSGAPPHWGVFVC